MRRRRTSATTGASRSSWCDRCSTNRSGRQLGITRENLGTALRYAFEGTPVGRYRDGIRVLPILMRAPEDERADVGNLQDVTIWSPVLDQAVPAAQVISGFETVFENAVLRSRDRIRTIIASCNPTGELATPAVQPDQAADRGDGTAPGLQPVLGRRIRGLAEGPDRPRAFAAGGLPADDPDQHPAVRQDPPAADHLAHGAAGDRRHHGRLLAANGAFDFMSLLGALSLIGLLIKNAIVLIDEIDQQIEEGKEGFTAILDATVSRLRPVVLAAATTILGLIPLLSDVFFVNMSITIMAGLGFATVLTLVFVPTLYAMMFRIESK